MFICPFDTKNFSKNKLVVMANFYDQLAAANTEYDKILKSRTKENGEPEFGAGDIVRAAQGNKQQRADALAIAAHQEEYNKPINAAARLREAGLNPDLQGLGNAGSASEPNLSPQALSDNTDQVQFQSAMDVTNTTLAAFQQALGMVESIQGIQGKSMSNDLLRIQENESLENYVARYVAANPDFEKILHSEGSDIFSQSLSEIPGLSRRQRKRAETLSTSRFNSLRTLTQYYKDAGDAEKATLDYLKTRGERLGLGTDNEDVIRTMQIITDLKVKYEKNRLKADNAKAMYDQDVYVTADGAEEGTAMNSDAKLRQEQYNQHSFQREMIQALNEEAKNGNGFAQTVLFFKMMLEEFKF